MQPEPTTLSDIPLRPSLGEVSPRPNFLLKLVNSVAGTLHKSAIREPEALRRGMTLSKYMLMRTRRSRNIKDYKQWAAMYRCYKYLFDVSQIPNSLKRAMQRGWYLPLELSLELAHRDDLFAEGAEVALDNFLRNRFANDIGSLSQNLYRIFPDRTAIIESAVKAHTNALFFLSVPVFFTQADGVCKGFLFKSKGGRKARLREFLLTEISEDADIIEVVTQVITQVTDIDLPTQKVSPAALNRHAVLHGESINYGTEENSLKAFSLLAFIGSLME